MQGYDKNEAVKFITANIDKSAHKGFSPKELDSLLLKAVELDLKYMEDNGVIVNGVAGDNYYDDDDAFEYISDNLIKLYGGNDQTAMRICALVDDYMDLQERYMTQAGLVDWD